MDPAPLVLPNIVCGHPRIACGDWPVVKPFHPRTWSGRTAASRLRSRGNETESVPYYLRLLRNRNSDDTPATNLLFEAGSQVLRAHCLSVSTQTERPTL